MYLMITFSIYHMVGKCIRIENQFLNNPTIIFIYMDMHNNIHAYTYLSMLFKKGKKWSYTLQYNLLDISGQLFAYN